jgi:gluconolactonase
VCLVNQNNDNFGYDMTGFKVIASGLRFPEGPIAMDDGSVILVEIERGTLSRVGANGDVTVVAELGGGPNGAAVGPDGRIYICNNGGFEWNESGGLLFPGHEPETYSGGRIEAVDLSTGAIETIYTSCDGNQLRGPNDLVFDAHGGFYFTDHGKTRERDRDRGGVYYAASDGSMIKEIAFPMDSPNGIGLSPNEQTLYVAETITGRLWAFDLDAPGQVSKTSGAFPGRLVCGLEDRDNLVHMFDSLAVDANGNVCVATLINGGITVISPEGNARHMPFPDILTTNICFGGEDLRTAYVCLSSSGKLVSLQWESAGLALNFLNK